MTIEIYTGFPGSGKSYHAVRDGLIVADAPRGNGWVVANFPVRPKKSIFSSQLREPRWVYKPNEDITVDFLVQFSFEKGFYGRESSALLIIDEAGVKFNARDWNVRPDERKNWIKFFSQHRKFGYDVILVAQDVRMIDRQIRSLCEYEVQHKKMNNYMWFRFLPVTVFAAVKFWNGLKNIRGSLQFLVYSKRIAERYDTMKLFDLSLSKLEENA